MGYCQVWLTCKDRSEANKITNALLEKRLAACVKQLPISSAAWWKGKIESTEEILLMMESRLDLFDRIESEIDRLHSYATPVIQAVEVARISKKAEKWLLEETRDDQ